MLSQKLSVLRLVASALNQGNIKWAVGASLLLYFHSITDTFNDIDIIIDKKDISKADAIISKIGTKSQRLPNSIYATEFFYEYNINDVELDVMCNFSIISHAQQFCFPFDVISDIYYLDKTEIPLSFLEDWYVFYQLMPSREQKVLMIENHFKNTNTYSKDRFNFLLSLNLPLNIQKTITALT